MWWNIVNHQNKSLFKRSFEIVIAMPVFDFPQVVREKPRVNRISSRHRPTWPRMRHCRLYCQQDWSRNSQPSQYSMRRL